MTNTIGIDFGADVDDLCADDPCTVVWGDQSVTGTAGPVGLEIDVAGEGILNPQEVEVLTQLSDWSSSTPPAPTNPVTLTANEMGISAVQYAVLDRRVAQGAVVLRLRRI